MEGFPQLLLVYASNFQLSVSYNKKWIEYLMAQGLTIGQWERP
jgi:hypothetical protein